MDSMHTVVSARVDGQSHSDSRPKAQSAAVASYTYCPTSRPLYLQHEALLI